MLDLDFRMPKSWYVQGYCLLAASVLFFVAILVGMTLVPGWLKAVWAGLLCAIIYGIWQVLTTLHKEGWWPRG